MGQMKGVVLRLIAGVLCLVGVEGYAFDLSSPSLPNFQIGSAAPLFQMEPLDELPADFKSNITLTSPQNGVVYGAQIEVSGTSTYKMPFFVNGKRVEPDQNGAFKTSLRYKELFSKQPVWITFITPKKQTATLKRHVVLLPVPKEAETSKYAKNKDFLKTFYSPFMYSRVVLNATLSRAEFAYIVMQIYGLSHAQEGGVFNKTLTDVGRTHPLEQPIKAAISYGCLSADAYGCFYPNQPVTTQEFISTLKKVAGTDVALSVNPKQNDVPIRFEDVVYAVSQLPLVKNQLKSMDDLNEGFDVSEPTKLSWVLPLLAELKLKP
jgi:hypothetical protein